MVLHKDFFKRMSRFFPDKCTIQEYTEVRNDFGEPYNVWENAYENISAAIALNESEQYANQHSYKDRLYTIALAGVYEIKRGYRAYINNFGYEIIDVRTDNMTSLTQLIAKRIKHDDNG